jgi:hypothetical protein
LTLPTRHKFILFVSQKKSGYLYKNFVKAQKLFQYRFLIFRLNNYGVNVKINRYEKFKNYNLRLPDERCRV